MTMNADRRCCAPDQRPAPPDDPALCDDLARLAKALGHPARVQIMRILLASDTCMCGDIVEQLPLAQSTVSQHLKVLRDAGLITGEIDAQRVCYCADPAAIVRLRELLGELVDLGQVAHVT